MRQRWHDILFAVIVAAALAVAVLAALVWRGHFVSDGNDALPPTDVAARIARKTTPRHTGETVTLRGRKIWLELGAAGNVDVSVDGKERPIPTGTTNVLLR